MRLDKLLSQQENISRERATKLIKSGLVEIDGKVVLKPSFSVTQGKVYLTNKPTYVGRGYLKIADAAQTFGLAFDNKRVLDVGASTGGFTQYALEMGAKEVVALDVGRDQLDPLISSDPRVVNMEKTNIKDVCVENIGKFDVIIEDLSFISLTSVLHKIIPFLKEEGNMLCLIKPQFELGSQKIGKAGIVKSFDQQIEAINNVLLESEKLNLRLINIKVSGILGGKGNIEFFVLFSKTHGDATLDRSKLAAEIEIVKIRSPYV